MKIPSCLGLFLYGMCAVIWTVRATLEIVFKTYNYSIFWFVMNILCAALWIVAFFVNLKRYYFNKDE